MFRSYLWGMEISHFLSEIFYVQLGSDPTYEAWKSLYVLLVLLLSLKFRSYLWGMEIDSSLLFVYWFASSDPTYEAWKCLFPQQICHVCGIVPILPMRHGNNQLSFLKNSMYCGSDPTYEAWKLLWYSLGECEFFPVFRSYLWGMEILQNRERSSHTREFRSYLWGMEMSILWIRSRSGLRSDPTYEAWKYEKRGSCVLGGAFVPILPMRHGNPVFYVNLLGLFGGSDPTYEAWKWIADVL